MVEGEGDRRRNRDERRNEVDTGTTVEGQGLSGEETRLTEEFGSTCPERSGEVDVPSFRW